MAKNTRKKTKIQTSSSIADEFLDMLKRRSSATNGTSFTVVGERSDSKKGYYALCIVRDEDAKDGDRIQISAIGENMPVEDMAVVFESIIYDAIKAGMEQKSYA